MLPNSCYVSRVLQFFPRLVLLLRRKRRKKKKKNKSATRRSREPDLTHLTNEELYDYLLHTDPVFAAFATDDAHLWDARYNSDLPAYDYEEEDEFMKSLEEEYEELQEFLMSQFLDYTPPNQLLHSQTIYSTTLNTPLLVDEYTQCSMDSIQRVVTDTDIIFHEERTIIVPIGHTTPIFVDELTLVPSYLQCEKYVSMVKFLAA